MQNPSAFATLVAQYQILPVAWINYFAWYLPAFEMVIGVLLFLTPWVKEIASLMLILLILFIVALTQALVRDLGITCGCFSIEGAQDKKGAWVALIRDILLLIPNLYLLFKVKSSYIFEKVKV